MNQSTKDFSALLKKSKKVLLFISPDISLDSWAGASALANFFSKEGTAIDVFLEKNNHPLPYKDFFDPPGKIVNNLNSLRDFLLIFNTEKNKISKIDSREQDNQFIITLTPEKGAISPRDFSFQPAKFQYDLLITLGIPSLENLGEVYQKNTDLFFEVPKVNLDFHSNNENYGQVNLVDLASSSLCELLTKTTLLIDKKLTRKLAQVLLTGIIAETHSFQTPTTTPTTLNLAAQLIKAGAKQASIIRYLYKNQSLTTLKLWGKVMSRLEYKKNKRAVYSFLNSEDLLQTKASVQEIPGALDEIKRKFSQADKFGIFYVNRKGETKAVFYFNDAEEALKLSQTFEGKIAGTNVILNFKDKTFTQAEKQLLKQFPDLPDND